MVDLGFDPRRVIALVGPTGSGKTAVASALAQALPVEMVCMDSMQLYREMRIGTAAPTAEELAMAPSHLFGAFSVVEPMSCARYAEEASCAIQAILGRDRIPLLIGGTGLYMRFLFQPTFGLPKTDERLRARLTNLAERKGIGHLYRLLQRLDPEAAQYLNSGDRQRVMRFLEVRVGTGRSMLEHWSQQQAVDRNLPVTIGLKVERDVLWRRLKRRLEAMIELGLVQESQHLIDAGLRQAVERTGPIGYRTMFRFLDGQGTLVEAKERIYIDTRRYAKRQMTWFRKLAYIQWFPYYPGSGYNIALMLSHIRQSIVDIRR